MTVAQLLRALFNLGVQNNFRNSTAAADLFWLAFGTVIVAAIVYVSVRAVQYRRNRHTHPFGHTFSR